MNSFLFSLPFIGLGAILAWVCIYFWREGRDLRVAGVQTQAMLAAKYRKPGDTFLSRIENCFVTAEFQDSQGFRRMVEIRVPSRQWHLLRAGTVESIVYLPANPARARVVSLMGQTLISLILIFGMTVGAIFVLFGFAFMTFGVKPAARGPDGVAITAAALDPPPSKFDKTGVSPSSMIVSPRHDRAAILDEKGAVLYLRDLRSGTLLASTKGNHWRMLSWSPDSSRLAVAEGSSALVLDAATLQSRPGETYDWNPESAALEAVCPAGPPAWAPDRKRAAAACGNNIMIADSAAVRLLAGHRDRVLGIAWSPSGRRLASVGDDNYVRVWDPQAQRCLAVSEDYPYPRAIYFENEETIAVIDVALRQYTLHVAR
jgi:hypothetical protein